MPSGDLKIVNCSLVYTWGVVKAGVLISDGKITAVSSDSNLPSADKTIDAGGKFVIPGLVDPHNHISQGIYFPVDKETENETRAAISSGVTTIVTYLSSLKDSLGVVLEDRKKIVANQSYTDVAFHGQILVDFQSREIPQYYKLGVTSFKFFMSYKGPEGQEYGLSGADDGLLYTSFESTGRLPPPALAQVHAENSEINFKIRERLVQKGRKDLAAWSDSRPPFSEEEAIRRAIYLASKARCRLYVVHMSIGAGVALAARARAEGSDVIIETLPAFLTLTKNDKIGVLGKVMCPLRDTEDIEQLWDGIRLGVIDCVGSEHIAATKEKKLWTEDIWKAKAGFPGIETMLPVMLSEGVNKGRIPISKVVEVCCHNPAVVLGLHPMKGEIAVGSDADLVIVDMKKEKTVTRDMIKGGSDFSVHEGWTFKGWPSVVIKDGKVAAEDGEVLSKPGGKRYIPRPVAGAGFYRTRS